MMKFEVEIGTGITGMYWYVLVCTGIYWYILVYIGCW